MKKFSGLVSVLIINWNEKEFLKDCLKSIFSQLYRKIEIIVVDNASYDGSQRLLKKYSQRNNFTYIESDKNLGFSGGNNLALKHAKGEFILLLNADTVLERNVVSILVDFFKKHPNAGVVQPKLVFMSDHNKLDNIGAYLTWIGILYYYGLFKNASDPKYNKELKVYSTKGACMLVKREIIQEVGFLDDYMFTYFEESDFCHRVWLAGYECWYTPRATIYHYVGATQKYRDSYRSVYFGHRNRIRSFLKNFEAKTILFILPVHVLFLIGVVFTEFFRGNFRRSVSILKAIIANFFILQNTLKERKRIQTTIRKVKDAELAPILFKTPRLDYYYYIGKDLADYRDDEII